MKELRLQEIKAMLYRLLLCYVFYQIARGLFWRYNRDLIVVESVWEYFRLAYHGLAFDTTGILYINGLFIIASIIPLKINTSNTYQKFLFWLYFITNALSYAMNFGDFIYYKFSKTRLTFSVLNVMEHESNLSKVFWASLKDNFSILVWYVLLILLWILLYKRVKVTKQFVKNWKFYISYSLLMILLSGYLVVSAIRGDFRFSSRPINIVDASEHIKKPSQANIVLNSVFSFFRTVKKSGFKEIHLVDDDFVKDNVSVRKYYDRKVSEPRPNIVIFIVESFSREFTGAFNEERNIPNYESYTPFVDSLATKSLIFPNSFANGRISIHAMSSIFSGIPALKEALTSSPYANQKMQSIVSVCKELGYYSSFYHGAPNGSMDFLGFSNILGFDDYFGKTEYNNDDDFDGIWAIWDEPFLQYFAEHTGAKEPFLSTVFTASSHHPYQIPQKYEGRFKEGHSPMHKPIQYTDYAIRKYFETARTKPWFQNTIFVITGDHTNIPYYPEYKEAMNRFAVPILLYSPNPKYNLIGKKMDYVQQIDIYPTLVDLIGYNKPIRSWGRSLVSLEKDEHFIINSDGIQEQFIIGNYIYRFDGKKVTGVYEIEDLAMKNDIKTIINIAEFNKNEKLCKAWYQDYMNRVIKNDL